MPLFKRGRKQTKKICSGFIGISRIWMMLRLPAKAKKKKRLTTAMEMILVWGLKWNRCLSLN